MGLWHKVSRTTRAQQQRGWPQRWLLCLGSRVLWKVLKILKHRRDLPVQVCPGDAHPPCNQDCQVWVTQQCKLCFPGSASRASQPAVLGITKGPCTFPCTQRAGERPEETAGVAGQNRVLAGMQRGRKRVLEEKKPW